MKKEKWSDLKSEELGVKQIEKAKEILELKFQLVNSKLKNYSLIKKAKKELARIKTFLAQKRAG